MEINIDIRQGKVNITVDKGMMFDLMRYDNIQYWFINTVKQIVKVASTVSNCDKSPNSDTLQD